METGTNFLTNIVIFITLKQLVHIITKIHFNECILESLSLEIELRTSQPIQEQKTPFYCKKVHSKMSFDFQFNNNWRKNTFSGCLIHKIKTQELQTFFKICSEKSQVQQLSAHILLKSLQPLLSIIGFFCYDVDIFNNFLIILHEYSFTLNTCLV